MCIGNRDGGDDAVGPYMVDRLKDDLFVIDCGIVPENYTGIVKKHSPNNLIIIDAVDMELTPGEIRIIPKGKIGVMTISTHSIPISVLIEYLEQYVENIIFIDVQPKNMSGELTDSLKNSAGILIKAIKNKKINKFEINLKI